MAIIYYSDSELLDELRRVAEFLGKDSVCKREYQMHGKTNVSTLSDRFGSWNKGVIAAGLRPYTPKRLVRRNRYRKNTTHAGSALRFKVMKRDRFRCVLCGASPAKSLDVELHVDHTVPVAKGGLAVMENLQTLCSRCNLGKSDQDL